MTPTPASERAEILDALRGFALLGIIVSHVADFSGWNFTIHAGRSAAEHADAVAALVQDFLIRGKFYSLFSLLFGVGYAVQLESASRRNADFARHFTRRLSVLLVIGLAHAALWYGDILKDYALIGLALIPLRRFQASAFAWAAGLAFALRLVWPSLAWWLFGALGPMGAGAHPDAGFAWYAHVFAGADARASFFANLALVKLKALQLIYDGTAISILSMFLLGALLGRLRLHRALSGRWLARTFWICAPLGVIGSAVLAPLHAATPDFPPTPMWVLENSIYAVATPAMAIAYASGFAWLWSRGGAGAMSLLAPAGRMALTTYVSQTLVLMALFYGVGFGLYGRLGLIEGALAAGAIFALQCVVAALWLRWFQFGPIEWIWRRLTYGAPIPLRRGAPALAQGAPARGGHASEFERG
jgi:uncharacterized protein